MSEYKTTKCILCIFGYILYAAMLIPILCIFIAVFTCNKETEVKDKVENINVVKEGVLITK